MINYFLFLKFVWILSDLSFFSSNFILVPSLMGILLMFHFHTPWITTYFFSVNFPVIFKVINILFAHFFFLSPSPSIYTFSLPFSFKFIKLWPLSLIVIAVCVFVYILIYKSTSCLIFLMMLTCICFQG